MLDFLLISTRSQKRGTVEIVPKFIIKKSSDLMIRGGDFYAIWDEDKKLWSTDEQDVVRLVDAQLDEFAKAIVVILKVMCVCCICGMLHLA